MPTLAAVWRIYENIAGGAQPDYVVRKATEIYRQAGDNIRKAYRAGVRIAGGSERGDAVQQARGLRIRGRADVDRARHDAATGALGRDVDRGPSPSASTPACSRDGRPADLLLLDRDVGAEFTRRQFLTRTLRTSSLVALGAVVPQFVARTAQAAAPGKDNILVVLEMTGGNDGLNTVIPYADDLYHKARPTLRQTKDVVLRLDDHVGLHSAMQGLRPLWEKGQLAVVQGVGYPNPDRSHFEAMDVWQSADPKRLGKTGWLGRGALEFKVGSVEVPVLHVGPGRLPLALAGAPDGGAVSINDQHSFRLAITGGKVEQQKARRRLLKELSAPGEKASADDLASFVRRRQVQTLTAVETLRTLLEGRSAVPRWGAGLARKLELVAGLIAKGFGTRIFYVSLDGFDTHASQGPAHNKLLAELANSIGTFFRRLKDSGHDRRVRLLTFSEFGRRVHENGSRGTDHGAASCLFVAGPSVRGGVVGQHPSLKDLDVGDLKFHTDFRRIYATLLDSWLGCDSKVVLGVKWAPVKELVGGSRPA